MAAFTAIAIASLGYSVFQGIRAGRQQAQAGRQQQQAAESVAQLSDYNAQVAELQAEDAIERGADEEQRFRSQVRGIIGSQRAAFAGSNVDAGFGSALDVQADAAYLGELDALRIRNNAAREAWGYNVQAEDARRRATITRKEGVNLAAAGQAAATNAYIGAAGTVLSGTTSLLQARYGFGR